MYHAYRFCALLMVVVLALPVTAAEAAGVSEEWKAAREMGIVTEGRATDGLTRGEWAVYLAASMRLRISEVMEPCMGDVPVTLDEAGAVCALKEAGVVTGMRYRPAALLSAREQAGMLSKAFGWDMGAAAALASYPERGIAVKVPRAMAKLKKDVGVQYLVRALAAARLGQERYEGEDDLELLVLGWLGEEDAMKEEVGVPEAVQEEAAAESVVVSSLPADTAAAFMEKSYVEVDDAAFRLQGRYAVSNDTIRLATAGEDEDVAVLGIRESDVTAMWNLFMKLVPSNSRQDIVEVWVFSDGTEGTMAFVTPRPNTTGGWVLALDVRDAFQREGEMREKQLTYTFIHEYAHILSLNSKQATQGPTRYTESARKLSDAQAEFKRACREPAWYYENQCFMPEAYLYGFVNAFGAPFVSDVSTSARYGAWPEVFVTKYAAANVYEDFAETFAAFVLYEKPVGIAAKDEKVRWFWGYPELIALRAHMRSAAGMGG